MLKKGLVFVTIVLFVCMSVVPSCGITIKNSVSLDPYTPSDPFPHDGETDVPIDGVVLDWYDCNPWKDVYFGKSNPPLLVAESIRSCHYDPGRMDANTTYYCKIVGINGGGARYPGPIWNFTTGSWINHPPKPEITIERVGGGTGEGVYWIYIKLNDLDGDNIEGAFIVHDRGDFAWPINDPYHGDPPWANGTILQEQYYYGKGWHEIKVTCWDSWVKGTGYLEFTFPRSRVQSTLQSTAPSGAPLTFEINDLDIIWITLEEAWELLTDTGNGIQTPIDIRTDENWNDGFIDTPYPEHAVHFSKAKLETTSGLAEFIETYENKEIILYSNSNEGYTWLLYQSILMDAGYSGTVYAWEGGYDAWNDAGYPIRINTEPDPPTITGPVRGKPGVEYEYVFSTEDPENDVVSYYVEWGDDTSTGWTDYFDSGEEVAISHTWEEINWYNTIRCKAKDVYDVESDWSETDVPISNAPWRFLERLQNAFPILRQLTGI